MTSEQSAPSSVTVVWLPLGAGGRCVGTSGRRYESLLARREHRAAMPLFHCALEVVSEDAAYVIEMGPAWGNATVERGVVQTGPVGLRWLGHSALFRYEVRCWAGGMIDDRAQAVASQVVSRDPSTARAVLRAVRRVPPLTWGRDELGAGDMWNSNSLASWLLSVAGADLASAAVPVTG